MGAYKDITGLRFGRLTAVRPHSRNQYKRWDWEYRCDCGGSIVRDGGSVTSGNVRSCGCLRREVASAKAATHRRTGTPIHRTWAHMLRRCRSPDEAMWHRYGGRGIKVCERWNSFENFLADVGERPSQEYSLDRINNDGNYEPGNVRWATALTQQNNKERNRKVEYKGRLVGLTELAALTGIALNTLDTRWCRGWRGERLYAPRTDPHARRRR
jgi:hypothetical protein